MLTGYEMFKYFESIREKAVKETIILYDNRSYSAVVPLSRDSACYWGRYTEWNIGQPDSYNLFDLQHSCAPLIIVLLPEHRKVLFYKDRKPTLDNGGVISNVTDPILIQLCLHWLYLP